MGSSQKCCQLHNPSRQLYFFLILGQIVSREEKESHLLPYLPLNKCDPNWLQDGNSVPVCAVRNIQSSYFNIPKSMISFTQQLRAEILNKLLRSESRLYYLTLSMFHKYSMPQSAQHNIGTSCVNLAAHQMIECLGGLALCLYLASVQNVIGILSVITQMIGISAMFIVVLAYYFTFDNPLVPLPVCCVMFIKSAFLSEL